MQKLSKRFPIYRDGELLLLGIEQAVRHFPRYHKYTLGSQLRSLAAKSLAHIAHAINQPARRLHWLQRLELLLQELKIHIRLGKQLQAFRRFSEFEYIAKLTVSVSRQTTAWHQQLQRLRGDKSPQRGDKSPQRGDNPSRPADHG